MKINVFIVYFVLFPAALLAQRNETIISSTPSKVTVFLSGAEVYHQTDLKLVAGQNEFRFVGLPSSISINSVSFNLGEKAKILSISGEINTDGRQKINKERTFWEDSVKYMEAELTKLRNEAVVWEVEQKLLAVNQDRIGSNNGLSLIELQTFSAHYISRTRDLVEKVAQQKQKVEQWTERLEKIKLLLNKVKTRELNANFEISLIVISKENQVINTNWSYVISEAGWSPVYDLRSKGVGKPITFTYKGDIFNNSGMDWKNIKLTLSTADVTQNTNPPYLTAWKLDFASINDLNYYAQQQQSNANMLNNRLESEESGAGVGLDRAGSITTTFSDIAVSELSIEFEIKELYNILADNRAYSVEINEYELKADYTYICTPKMDKDAFLMARILGWETLNLIEGNANIYFNDSYIGKTFINLRRANDTLDISLGRDKKVIVNRIKKQDFSSRKFLSSTVRELYTYEINVRNTNSLPISLDLKDQLPTSGNGEIEIEILEISSAKLNPDSGLLTWNVNLAQGEAKTYTISYAIKYPKNKTINLNKTKIQRQYKK
jgi:uncharacterized protein (TIGR02231 family)